MSKLVEELLFKTINLEGENRLLRKELQTRKSSNNSSMPPSTDLGNGKKNQSLRKKGNQKRGGQTGHKGSTLKMTETPDKIIERIPCFCDYCGYDLESTPSLLKQKRQVVDIPPIVPVYTEYRSYSKTCICGHENRGNFPSDVKAPIQYGSRVNSLVSYFSIRQYMPYQRMKESFNDIFGIEICQATLVNIIKKMALKSLPAYNKIKDNILKSPTVGSDETGAKVNGNKAWFWVWQNKTNTFITAAQSRGFIVIENEFPDGLPNSILESDSLAAQLKTKARGDQLCLAHLMRELQYFIELYDDDWSKNLLKLLSDSLKLKKRITNYQQENEYRNPLEKRLDELLAVQVEKQPEKVKPFHKRLIKHKSSLFPFLYYQDVCPDNNASERAIRNLKVKQKISGQFISLNSAMNYAVLRSIIDTCLKNGINVLNNLKLITQLAS